MLDDGGARDAAVGPPSAWRHALVVSLVVFGILGTIVDCIVRPHALDPGRHAHPSGAAVRSP